MRRIKNFSELFEGARRPVVSFDFDGVLHKSVVGISPVDFMHPATWEPSERMFDQVWKEAENNEVVVVTARDSWNEPEVAEYIKMHRLPISKIYCTDDEPKLPTLRAIGAIRHYDDRDISRQLRGSGVEFMLVDAKSGTFHKME
jgi:hypothetical protein